MALFILHCIGPNHNKHLVVKVTSTVYVGSLNFVAIGVTTEKCYSQKT